jgi:hypothetical protein
MRQTRFQVRDGEAEEAGFRVVGRVKGSAVYERM